MRIAMISTYPPIECGIATYSENLCNALRNENNEILVISQHGASGDRVYPVYNAADDNIAAEIFTMLAKLTPDLVHIQHEFGLYGVQHGIQINELILRLRMEDLPVVVTLHTVRSPMPRDDEIILGNIIRDSALTIVHEAHQKAILADKFGIDDRVRVIPHGIRDFYPVPGARDLLGLSGKKVALLAGYCRPTKRFDRIIGLWPRVVERNPDAVLLMAGKMRGIEYSEYHDSLIRMAKESPVADQILCLRGQFPQYTFDAIISAADCMVLPYEAGAQSGILANAAAFHVPVVTSDLESFTNWNEESGGGLTAATDDEFVEHLTRVLTDENLNRTLRNNVKDFIQPYLWDAIGGNHQAVYEEILNRSSKDTRYFYIPDPDG